MSVKYALLALLAEGSKSAYQLRVGFESATDHAWRLNDGQVAQTLDRLERDRLVKRGESWSLTPKGRVELNRWWTNPVSRRQVGRDELVIKLALAARINPQELLSVIQRQRESTRATLREISISKCDEVGTSFVKRDLAWSLAWDYQVFQLQTELRWLEHIERRLSSLELTDIAKIFSQELG